MQTALDNQNRNEQQAQNNQEPERGGHAAGLNRRRQDRDPNQGRRF